MRNTAVGDDLLPAERGSLRGWHAGSSPAVCLAAVLLLGLLDSALGVGVRAGVGAEQLAPAAG